MIAQISITRAEEIAIAEALNRMADQLDADGMSFMVAHGVGQRELVTSLALRQIAEDIETCEEVRFE